MKYVLGLDIGITSVGWAVLNLDDKRIEDLGVRAFNKAEHPKNGASLAAPRRLARGMRRRLRRRAGRLSRAKDLMIQYGLIDETLQTSAFETSNDVPCPWQLRCEGLDRILTGEELARALFHIIKRRGFKSNRKKIKKDEDGQVLSNIGTNRQIMEQHGYRTAGEMIWKDEKFSAHKRNASDSYENTVDREMLEQEIKTLFQRQKVLGNSQATPEFERDVLSVFAWQKPFASGDDILKLVGTCTFEEGELRAPRNSYHAERFMLLQKINSATYSVNGDRSRFTADQRAIIERLAYTNSKVTYAQIRKVLNLSTDVRFAGLTYTRKSADGERLEESPECEGKTKFCELKGYHVLRKACSDNGVWEQVCRDADLMDHIASAVTFYKTDHDIRTYLAERYIDEDVINAALDCEFDKTANLSLVAIKKILPHLEQGLHYSEACEAAGYNHCGPAGGEKFLKLPAIPVDMIRNPVVLRALSQARKVVNAVIDRYGSPYRVHIELARDMGKSAEDRRRIETRQKDNLKEREELEEQFVESFGRKPSSTDLLKWRLYREQNGQCAYSMQPMELESLFSPGYVEIDHILPYSRSFDDGRTNKALVLGSQNRNKGNRTPFELFAHDDKRWTQYDGWVRANIRDPRKRANLLRENYDEKAAEEWKERNLNDTRYITREFATFLRHNLLFLDTDHKNPLVCLNGSIVARARWLWGLEKNRAEDDLHHARDAAVIAALVPHQQEVLTAHAQATESRRTVNLETGEVIEWDDNERPRLPQPWKGFRNEIMEKAASIQVSRMPLRGVTGAIHKETIRSSRNMSANPASHVRKPLNALTVSDLDSLIAPETNQRLYEAIRERMRDFNNDAKSAFQQPLLKPTRDGSPGPIVKTVKVWQTQNTGIMVRGGIADNGDMARIDLSRKQDAKGIWKYYCTPVYVSQVMSAQLPDIAGEFLFSLYPFDLVLIERKTDTLLGYYRSYNVNTQSITICEVNDVQALKGSIGLRNAVLIQKLEMGVLGDHHRVRREVRRGVENGRNLESSEAES